MIGQPRKEKKTSNEMTEEENGEAEDERGRDGTTKRKQNFQLRNMLDVRFFFFVIVVPPPSRRPPRLPFHAFKLSPHTGKQPHVQK